MMTIFNYADEPREFMASLAFTGPKELKEVPLESAETQVG